MKQAFENSVIKSMVEMQKTALKSATKTGKINGDNAMTIALKQSGYKLRKKSVSWPRLKGPSAIRIDCQTATAVEFLK